MFLLILASMTIGWLAVVTMLVLLRVRTDGKFDVKMSDAVIAIIPILIVLVVTGYINLDISKEGSLSITAARAFVDAAAKPISQQVALLPVTAVNSSEKGGMTDLATVVNERKAALAFRLGRGGYYVGQAISSYLHALSANPDFRYVVIDQPQGPVFGLLDARKLIATLESKQPLDADGFARALNDGDTGAIGRLPSFVPAALALRQSADKQAALRVMEEKILDWLPVVDGAGNLVGIVERSRLTASLILDATDQLRNTQTAPVK